MRVSEDDKQLSNRRDADSELDMDITHLVELPQGLAFRQAVWLFPLAIALHFLEEAPHFADWAYKYAWPGYPG
jgi:hypothetical protein